MTVEPPPTETPNLATLVELHMSTRLFTILRSCADGTLRVINVNFRESGTHPVFIIGGVVQGASITAADTVLRDLRPSRPNDELDDHDVPQVLLRWAALYEASDVEGFITRLCRRACSAVLLAEVEMFRQFDRDTSASPPRLTSYYDDEE